MRIPCRCGNQVMVVNESDGAIVTCKKCGAAYRLRATEPFAYDTQQYPPRARRCYEPSTGRWIPDDGLWEKFRRTDLPD
jgi:hypothetical protein